MPVMYLTVSPIEFIVCVKKPTVTFHLEIKFRIKSDGGYIETFMAKTLFESRQYKLPQFAFLSPIRSAFPICVQGIVDIITGGVESTPQRLLFPRTSLAKRQNCIRVKPLNQALCEDSLFRLIPPQH